jgi:hypothetical protein
MTADKGARRSTWKCRSHLKSGAYSGPLFVSSGLTRHKMSDRVSYDDVRMLSNINIKTVRGAVHRLVRSMSVARGDSKNSQDINEQHEKAGCQRARPSDQQAY